MRARASFAVALALALAGLRPVTGQDATLLVHDRLELDLPGVWTVEPGERVVTAKDGRGGVVVLRDAEERLDASAEQVAAAYVAATEQGRALVEGGNSMPAPVDGPGRVPYVWQVRVTRGDDGRPAFVCHVVFTVGRRFQVAHLSGASGQAFQRLMQASGMLLGGARARLAPAAEARAPDGWRQVRRLGLELRVPPGWKDVEATPHNVLVFDVPVDVGDMQLDVRAVVDVQLRPATAPWPSLRRALEAGLTGKRRLDVATALAGERTTPRVLRPGDGRYGGGDQFVSTTLEHVNEENAWLARTFGVVRTGPGCHLVAAVGMGTNQLSVSLDRRRRMIDAWPQVVADFGRVIDAARWGAAPARQPELEAWLVRRGTFRYHHERSMSGGGTTFFSARTRVWRFAGDVVTFEDEHVRGTTHSEPGAGGVDRTAAYLTDAPARGEARFAVLRAGDELVVTRRFPGGWVSAHPASLADERFELDGLPHTPE